MIKEFISLLLCMTLFLSSFVGPAVSDERGASSIELPPEGLLYQEAGKKLTDFPADLRNTVNEIIRTGWRQDEKLVNFLLENKEAVALFKKATLQPNEGFIFGKRPEKLNADTEHPNYVGEINLFKLTLLEGKMHEAKGEYDQAGANYLTAIRFIHHLSQQRFSILLSMLIEGICLEMAAPSITESLQKGNFSRGYYNDLDQILADIVKNQDFLKGAFEEESEIMKNSVRMVESIVEEESQKTKKDEEFRKAIGSIPFLQSQLKRWNQNRKSEFFSEFYKITDSNLIELREAQIRAARENKIEVYKRKLRELEKRPPDLTSNWRFFNSSVFALKQKIFGGKSFQQTLGHVVAKIFLSLGAPSYSKIIERYHIFHNQLHILVVGVGLKRYQMDHGALPDTVEQLVPNYLDQVPQDTFNQFRPLSYKRKAQGYIIYSFGPDREDDGGEITFDRKNKTNNQGDIVLFLTL